MPGGRGRVPEELRDAGKASHRVHCRWGEHTHEEEDGKDGTPTSLAPSQADDGGTAVERVAWRVLERALELSITCAQAFSTSPSSLLTVRTRETP